jgi:hypothetical protein
MQTKKRNKRKNKLTRQYQTKSFGGGLSDEVEELKEKPSYMKYTLLMLGLSSCFIFLKLTKG